MKRMSYFDVLTQLSRTRAPLRVALGNQLFEKGDRAKPMDDSVQALRDFVMKPENTFLRAYISDMIDAANRENPITIKTADDFFIHVNEALASYPKFDANFMMALPFFLTLAPFMSTGPGWAFFTNETVRPYWAKILDAYHQRLDAYPASCVYLDHAYGNWFSPDAWRCLNMDEYKYDPVQPHGGYRSWNEFFKRQFKDIEKSRPLPPNSEGLTITSPVDGQVFQITNNVQLQAPFNVKGEQYYLTDLLHEPSDSELLRPFVDGLAVQIVLMPVNYHRWHSPVTGKVKKVETVPGYFFAQPTPETPYADSFPFLSHVNSRTIFVIESSVGMCAMVFVGLTEVSSTVPCVKDDDLISQGQEIGNFAYGGSTCCILFERKAISQLYVSAAPDPAHPHNEISPDNDGDMPNVINVRAALALALAQ